MIGLALVAAFAATVPLANWMVVNVGSCSGAICTLPIGFGLQAPSGVLVAGAALVLRDMVHERVGLRGAVTAVMIGALATIAVSPPALALASFIAFVTSETVDTAAYAVVRRQGQIVAVAVSGLVSSAVDSAAFLLLAFGSLDFAAGHTLGKIYASIAVSLWIAGRRYV